MILDPQIVGDIGAINQMKQLIGERERNARILVVDDDVAVLHTLTQILRRAGFANLHGLAEAGRVIATVRGLEPDVVLLDLHMPGANGIDVISEINAHAGPCGYLPVLVLTGDASVSARDAALAAGARDFLTKPYETTEVVLRVRNLVETRLLQTELQRQNELLLERFTARTEELEAAKLEILERLARASDFRDESTYAHTARVGELAAQIARCIGLDDTEVEQLRVAARLHDIGKIGLSDSILQKPGPLVPAEFAAQEMHTVIGANILAGSRFPILRLAEEIALTHHEAWDGSGYPRGLAGEEIPISGRIVSVADVFDALTHARPYKEAWSIEQAVAEIEAQSGTKFDPAVAAAFLDVAAATLVQRSADRQLDAELELVGPHAESQRARIVRDIIRGRALG
ncbi:MAG: HD-GYP domain-containing protein [Gemmatimonadota bacterium]